jgi:subtilase family serine protease
MIVAQAPVAQLEPLFGVEFHEYRLRGERRVMASSAPRLPRSIAPYVAAIVGLSDELYFRKGQGPGAPGGKKSYVGDGKHMTIGYALVAYPAAYDNTGRNTFLINNTGTVYQCDLGPETHAIVKQMTEYDPKAADRVWTPAE